LVIDVVVSFDEANLLVDSAGADVALVPLMGEAELCDGARVRGADVQAVAALDDPDRHRFT